MDEDEEEYGDLHALPAVPGLPPVVILVRAGKPLTEGIPVVWLADEGRWIHEGFPVPDELGEILTEQARRLGVPGF
jgi:hypothetical protein